jgi:hypothetical protein
VNIDSSVPAGACGGPPSRDQSETRRYLGDAANLALAQRPSQLIASEALLEFPADSQGTWATNERLGRPARDRASQVLGEAKSVLPGERL